MINCWASVLGGCDRQSREHYNSRSLWTNDELMVTVSSLYDGKPKKRNIHRLWKKILCIKHNNALSLLDDEAGKLFKGIESVIRQAEKVSKLKRSSLLRTVNYQANGKLIERWLFKFVIQTLMVLKIKGNWAISKNPIEKPSEDVVKMIFGFAPIKKPLGIYIISKIGDNLEFTESVKLLPYVNDNGEYTGALVFLRTLAFVVWIENSEINQRVEIISGEFLNPEFVSQSYHFEEFTFTTKGKVASRLKFNWD